MRDPNDTPTVEQLAASYFGAHERVRERMKAALSAAQGSGYRGFVDVGWFYPSAPLALGNDVRMALYPVDAREAPLPFGWTRYEISDAKEVRVVARGRAEAAD